MAYQLIQQTSPASSVVDLSLPNQLAASSSSHRASTKLSHKELNDRFQSWIQGINKKRQSKARKLRRGDEDLEVYDSVFGTGADNVVKLLGTAATHEEQASHEQFQLMVVAVNAAIRKEIHPKLISKGSSGSYFARDPSSNIVSIFKPANEEPYGSMNPKFTKWVHRTFFRWIGWGRACLIPGLSYVSEAAACVLDRRLGLNIVPQTELVSLASPAFFYDYLDRNAYTKGKPLPDKLGSMQWFCRGYTDAAEFLRAHPFGNSYDESDHRIGKHARELGKACQQLLCGCGRAGAEAWDEEDDEQQKAHPETSTSTPEEFRWTEDLKRSFSLELEKLVALDFLMRNTDRGLDNFMLKLCKGCEQTPSVAEPSDATLLVTTAPPPSTPQLSAALFGPKSTTLNNSSLHFHLVAIDNSLSFPHKHPDAWRVYPYGWLFLPASIIGQPFSRQLRDHLIPILSSPTWWKATIEQIRRIFERDDGFSDTMFEAQMSVFRGQGLTLLETLQDPDGVTGPLELCRAPRKIVKQDVVEVLNNADTAQHIKRTAGAIDSSNPNSPRPIRRNSGGEPSGFANAIQSNWRGAKSASGVQLMKVMDRIEGDRDLNLKLGYQEDLYSDEESLYSSVIGSHRKTKLGSSFSAPTEYPPQRHSHSHTHPPHPTHPPRTRSSLSDSRELHHIREQNGERGSELSFNHHDARKVLDMESGRSDIVFGNHGRYSGNIGWRPRRDGNEAETKEVIIERAVELPQRRAIWR